MGFRDWLEETIEWKGLPVARWWAIREFLTNGLVPFVKGKGYDFAYDTTQLCNLVATGMYASRGKSCLDSVWPGPRAPDGAYEEDESHFYAIFSVENWNHFWSIWGYWSDVDPDESSRGNERRIDIEAATWKYIDLANSAQTRVLDEILQGDEDEAVPSRHGQQGTDTYYQDAEQNGWGGYRK
jgi:hypothetical protein